MKAFVKDFFRGKGKRTVLIGGGGGGEGAKF